MVSTSSGDRRAAPKRRATSTQPDGYRRRRPLPAIIFLTVLSIVVAVVWVQVLTKQTSVASSADCPPPNTTTGSTAIEVGAPPVPPGTKVTVDDLAQTPPAAPKATQVRVLNANGQRGQAALVAAQLAQLGFGPAPDGASGNDPVYTSQNMQCRGQVRFGPAGTATARTVGLLVPCAELVQDTRKDTIVDLALGSAFTSINTDTEVSAVLSTLTKHAADPASPGADAAALSAARNVTC